MAIILRKSTNAAPATPVAAKATKAAPVKKATKKAATKKAAKPEGEGAYRNAQPSQAGKTASLGIAESLRFILDANSFVAGIIPKTKRFHKDAALPKGMVIGKPFTDEQLRDWMIAEFPGRTSAAFCNIANARRMYNQGVMRHQPGLQCPAESVAFAYDAAGNAVALEPGKRTLAKPKAEAAPAKAAPAKKAAPAAKGLVVKKATAKKAAPAPAKKAAKKASK